MKFLHFQNIYSLYLIFDIHSYNILLSKKNEILNLIIDK